MPQPAPALDGRVWILARATSPSQAAGGSVARCSASQRLVTQRCTKMSTTAASTNTWARHELAHRARSPAAASSSGHVQRRVERVRVPPQPGAVGEVGRAARGDQRPEPRAVAEDAQVGELVDHDRLERRRRRQDEPPREHQPALARGAPPAAPWVADVDACRAHAERRRVRGDRPLDRLAARSRSQAARIRSSERRSPGARRTMSSSPCSAPARSTVERRPAARGPRRRGSRCSSPRYGTSPPSRAPPRARAASRSRASSSRCRRTHACALPEERLDPRLRAAPSRGASRAAPRPPGRRGRRS